MAHSIRKCRVDESFEFEEKRHSAPPSSMTRDGSAYGATSPVQVSSTLFYVEAQMERRGVLDAPGE